MASLAPEGLPTPGQEDALNATEQSLGPDVNDPASTRFSSNMCGLGRCIAFMNLKACSACKLVQYCCKEHQVEHYKKEGHKIVCKGRLEGTAPNFDTLSSAARKYQSSGSYRMALLNYGSMLELTEQTLDNVFHSQCAKLLEQMADCYKRLNEPKCAVEAYSRMLMILDFNNDNNDPAKNAAAFKVMGQWAECWILMGNYELALDAFKKIEQSAIEFFGDQSLQRAQAFMSQGNCHVELRSVDKAEVSYKLALSLEHCGQSSVTNEMLYCSRVHYNYGLLLSALSRHTEAAEQFSQCIAKKTTCGVAAGDAALMDARQGLASAEKGFVCANAQTLLEPREVAGAEAMPQVATKSAEEVPAVDSKA